ncbi:MAG: bifunctional glutamate N-acetyltransferase/amino-acid acetyltransferase ArgJ [Phycisphaerae bacterium]|nr:bifunctional glutamate N-acetyltransferase/amino-acid acetyltransferase ArgJ [Phycisphaerae bacterium]
MTTTSSAPCRAAASAADLPLPRGFACSGVVAGIKKSGAPDLGLLVCAEGAVAAGMFTRNLVAAAPIQVSRANLARSRGHCTALLVNSGCANAATGPRGLAACHETIDAVARLLDCTPDAVLVNSTGVIGVLLPSDRIVAALPALHAALTTESCAPFATAIMTTDTRAKVCTRTVGTVRVTGMAKGAGMIHPDMATMIVAITTDAAVDAPTLDRILRRSVDRSFHRISVDGDTSTNDSVFALASGQAGACDEALLQSAFDEVCTDLAMKVVQDGEGFERGIKVTVTGAATPGAALQVARTVAMSLLVRTAVTGGDPNWGRILAAAGRAGVPFDVDDLRVGANGVPLFEHGAPAESAATDRRAAFTADIVHITIDLGQGSCSDVFHSCGLTKRYIEINADYTT